MKPIVLGIVVVLAVLTAGYMFTLNSVMAPTPQTALNSYANETYGISFSYPVGYLLAEEEQGTLEQRHYVITLIREEDAVPVVAGGEGPTAITIDIYQNTPEPSSLYGWLSETAESNFALGDGTYASTTIDTAEAVHYGWSGLYEGETRAFLHNDRIIAVSVTYMSPADAIRSAYDTVLTTFLLR